MLACITSVSCGSSSISITFNSTYVRAEFDERWTDSRNVVNGTPITGGPEWGCLNANGTKVGAIYRFTRVNTNGDTHTISSDGLTATVFTTDPRALYQLFNQSNTRLSTNRYSSSGEEKSGRRGF